MIEIYNIGKMNELRTCIWKRCGVILTQKTLYEYARDILKNYGDNRRETQDKSIYELDFACIREYIIPNIDIDSLDACALLHHMERRYKRTIGKTFPELQSSTLKSYNIYKIFKSNPYDFDEDWDIGGEMLEKYRMKFAKELKVKDYRDFMVICEEIGKLDDDNYTNSEMMLLVMMHTESFVDILENYLSSNTPFDVHPISILPKLIEDIGYKNVFDFVGKFDFDKKEYWEYLLYSIATSEDIDEELFANVKNYFEQTEKLTTGYLRDLMFLINFKKYDKWIVSKTASLLFDKSDDSIRHSYFYRFFHDDEQVESLFNEFENNYELLEAIYVYLLERNELYDPKGKVCRKFIARNADLIYTVIDHLCKDRRSRYGSHSTFDYSIIWELDVEEIVKIIEYVFDEHIQYSFENTLDQFFLNKSINANTEKRDAVIIKMITSYNDIRDRMQILFHIIAYLDDETRIKYYLVYLTVNKSLEAFQYLPFSKSSESWSGSQVPILAKKQDFLKKLLEHIEGVELLAHKSYLKEVIKSYDESIKNTRVQELLEDY